MVLSKTFSSTGIFPAPIRREPRSIAKGDFMLRGEPKPNRCWISVFSKCLTYLARAYIIFAQFGSTLRYGRGIASSMLLLLEGFLFYG